jgi:hypothetical protein
MKNKENNRGGRGGGRKREKSVPYLQSPNKRVIFMSFSR